MRTHSLCLAWASAALVATACSSKSGGSTNGGGGNGGTTVMTLNDGDGQNGAAGATLAVAPSVKLTNDNGPVANVAVTFAVTSGGGSLGLTTAASGSDGVARAGAWVLGTAAGANTVTASAGGVSGSPVTFHATAHAASAAVASKTAGDGQSAAAGTTVPIPPAVLVADQFGNAVAGATVTFAVAQGGGGITGPASVTTGSDGVATVGGWTLGTTVGANQLSAIAPGTASGTLLFDATAVAGAAATLAKVAGDSQSANAGTAVAVAPQVRLADQFGNPIGGATATFTVASGGGAVTGGAQPTAGDGTASVGSWTLGPTAGPNALTASANGLTATFTATALAVLDAAQYVGSYTGSWTNTTFASTGGGTVTISIDQATSTATVTASATGNVLGTPGGVTPGARMGPYASNGASFTGTIAVMGDITASIDASGNIIASGINIPNAAISRWDANGTITATQIKLNFTVTFTAGPPATGSITLNKT